jgi:hypothetical protein
MLTLYCQAQSFVNSLLGRCGGKYHFYKWPWFAFKASANREITRIKIAQASARMQTEKTTIQEKINRLSRPPIAAFYNFSGLTDMKDKLIE